MVWLGGFYSNYKIWIFGEYLEPSLMEDNGQQEFSGFKLQVICIVCEDDCDFVQLDAWSDFYTESNLGELYQFVWKIQSTSLHGHKRSNF